MPTKKQSRLRQLQKIVEDRRSIHIRDAAEMLDVSEMTIRRDIRETTDIFEFLGGHIIFANASMRRAPYDLLKATDLNETHKRAACAACRHLVQPQDTLFVDCGTTLPHLVAGIPDDMELTIICYALNIADQAIRKPNVKLVLLGGIYYPQTASFYPPDQDVTLDSFAINRAFLSAAGVDKTLGATCTTFREAALKKAAMERAQQKILVTDSSKLGKAKSAAFARLEDFDLIATEAGLKTAGAFLG